MVKWLNGIMERSLYWHIGSLRILTTHTAETLQVWQSSDVFYLSLVREYCLLIHSSNLWNSAYNFMLARSTTIGYYFRINYLFKALEFLPKIGILSIISEFKSSKVNIFRLFSFTISHERILTCLFIWDINTHSIRFTSIPYFISVQVFHFYLFFVYWNHLWCDHVIRYSKSDLHCIFLFFLFINNTV